MRARGPTTAVIELLRAPESTAGDGGETELGMLDRRKRPSL